MTTTRELLQQALEALELAHPRFGTATQHHSQAIAAIRSHLEKPEPEPAAWIGVKDLEMLDKHDALVTKNHVAVQVPLYTKENI